MPNGDNVQAQLDELLSGAKSEIDISKRARIFCNRNLKMESIGLIGFDMDYTLALYHQERLEQLSIELTLAKLVENHGYPDEVQSLTYDSRYAIRGLVIDRKLGNVFKMDRHRYVGRVFHGKRKLADEERRELYQHTRIQLSDDRFHWIDTLFGLPEAVMYGTLVEFFDKRGGDRPSYDQLFTDIRKSIDAAHADGTLKTRIKANLEQFIVNDPTLAEMLHKLRSAGKKTFLLTNSYYAYTQAVMTYLLDGVRKAYPSWRNYFDVVIVGGTKPGFFTKNRPFISIDPVTGEEQATKVTSFTHSGAYQGGNITDFEQMTGFSGDSVLYIGDHIYGDLLRLKKSHIWRTAMVVQELDRENVTGERLEQQIKDLGLLDRRRRNLASEIDYQSGLLKRLQRLVEEAQSSGADALVPRLDEARSNARDALDSLRVRSRVMHEEVAGLEETIERAYNPYWGGIFREGNEGSRFGDQVSEYADLYTSRVSNFAAYSPLRYFRAPRRLMPHEL